MKQGLLWDLAFQVAALIIAFLLVHVVYTTIIRPEATLIQEQQAILQQTDENYVPERSVFVILKDFEQETCIVLFFWAVSIIGTFIADFRKLPPIKGQ